MLLLITAVIVGIVTLFYLYIKRNYNYWNSIGVDNEPAVFPYGSIKNILKLEKTIGEHLADIYRKHHGKRLIGFCTPFEPMLLIRDPELIKTVLVKEFNNFHINGFAMNKHVDPLLGNNPFCIHGLQEWKEIRSMHTNVTSVLKIKNMITGIINVANNLVKYISTKCEEPIEMKATSRFFTNDSVAMSAYGIESDSFFDMDSPFNKCITGELFGTSFEGNWACFSSLFFPPIIGRIFRWRTMTVKAEKFFIEMAESCIAHRKKNNVFRNDLIQQLMIVNDKAIKENTKPMTDLEMAAACMTFFIDGVETSSEAMAFALFELAANPEIQNKLREEIKMAVTEVTDLDFDKVWSLSYLDMVLSESLRKYPALNFQSRMCSQDTTLDGVKIVKGTKVFIPSYGLHMDPEYFPEPEKFIPERFSKEKRSEMNKFVYLPFGEGPRICLGAKFAQTQIKVAIVALILKFRLSLAKDISNITSLSMDADSTFLTVAKEDINIVFTPINN